MPENIGLVYCNYYFISGVSKLLKINTRISGTKYMIQYIAFFTKLGTTKEAV